ncbi:immunoglobulin alpha-2 heavy chain-like [Cetorhinus maximus]
MTKCVDKQDCHSVEMIGETLFAVILSLCIAGGTAGPVLIQSPSLERVTEGQTVRLQCTMQTAAVRNTDVHWYRGQPGRNMEWILSYHRNGYKQQDPYFTGRLQPSRDTSSNRFILTITNVQPSDAGVYYCSVWGRVYGNGAQLIVTTGPVLIQSPSLERVTEGQTVRLQCTMQTAAVRNTDVHWYRGQPGRYKEWILSYHRNGYKQQDPYFTGRLQPSRDTFSNRFILTITNVQPSDAGVYYCSVWGRVYGNGAQLIVTSANAPVLIQSPSLERVTEGHTAQLQCTMGNAAVTDTDVHWYWELPGKDMEWVLTHDIRNITRRSSGFTGRLQPSRDTSNNSFILTITNVQPSDTAAYYCKVWGDISGNGTRLNITSPLADPVLLQYPNVSKVPEGETVELQCAMYNASVNDTDVHWHHQRPGYNSEWALSQFVNGTITKSRGFHDRFQLSRNVSSNSYILTIVNVTLNDTAVYNCSVWSYIYGAGTQLNVTDESSYNKPWTSDLIVLSTGAILGFIVLFCVALATLYLVKKRLCSAKNFTPGVPDEDQSPVYTTVNDKTWTSNETAVSPVLLGEGECNYAELQFHRRDPIQPTVTVAESTSEYAVVKRALN